ncbi:penicillin-binding transpeptidase domain-containing protein [Siminovitchia fortis]|uniref:serine-type D-Ala-D-Ala carboxypeptidase n=1 Tax=Siminovitchia fortis TaxID=254758 RepID=A0A443IQ11_9BACI|nr:penicillin-binding transpeptidase domain-containing protein [Siminovitchia fortis]RWR08091.1 penicillin-binding transpeptidase domain-containing protein [Siminovitchia fortis]WHY81047.1 penicillin-binding transpeptidase domain-containing protein [Siminovitchia fortis]
MKKWIGMLLLLLMALSVAGCNKEPKPEDRFTAYVKEWNDQNFEKMYDYLSEEAQEKISKGEFTDRYEKIYGDLEIENLKVDFKAPEEVEEKDGMVEFPFHVKMDSLAGEIAFDHTAVLKKEERDDAKNWFVNWDTTFIFPQLEEGDKISLPTTPAKRGDIVDKNGAGLAVTGKVTEIGIIPGEMGDDEEKIIKKVSDLLGLSEDQIKKALSASWVQPEHFVPLKKIPGDANDVLEKATAIPSVNNRTVEARVYPLGEAAAHLIGYVGPITAEELEKAGGGYQSSDVIGKRGLEQVFEKKLKGENGAKIVINKEDGTEEVLAEKEVKDGEDVQLTIDAAVQNKIFKELKGEAGTAAALNPVSGETLALVSSPSFDPNVLSLGATAKDWEKLDKDKKKPLVTRFKNGYAPGSVMKPITTAIALEAGAVDWNKTYDIKGLSWQKDSSWGGYSVTRVSDTNGPVDLEKALVLSDNIFFARTALDLGKDQFAAGLKKFGFEEDIPDYAYPLEQSKIGDIDSDIALADSAYGQGQIEMNIVHLATAYTPIINKGNMIQPVLVKGEADGAVWKKGVMSEKTAADIQNALLKVVEDPKGTARGARIEGKRIAGKTGTAEIKAKQGEKGKENGFFVAYDTEKPDMLVAMMVEDVLDRGGSAPAVDRVKKVLEK